MKYLESRALQLIDKEKNDRLIKAQVNILIKALKMTREELLIKVHKQKEEQAEIALKRKSDVLTISMAYPNLQTNEFNESRLKQLRLNKTIEKNLFKFKKIKTHESKMNSFSKGVVKQTQNK